MQKGLFKKGIVIVIIILFVGVGVQPALADLSIESDDFEFVEFTVQVGNIEYNVVLSSKQAEELENLMDNTKAQLDKATTIKETSKIFDETVVSLYKLGMLPDSISVEDAQRLVKGHHRFSRMDNVLDCLSGSKLGILDDDENLFCLVAGKTDNTNFLPLSYRLLLKIYELYNDLLILILIFQIILLPLVILWMLSPVVYGNIALLGHSDGPSHGWVYTIGLNGIKNWWGNFRGGTYFRAVGGVRKCYLGILGFNGISICTNVNHLDCFYLGFARQVKLDYYNP